MNERPLAFDVGLHRGEDTAFYLTKGLNVVAFEADPALIAECKEKFASEIAAGRLVIVEGAIAPPECGEEIAFYRSTNSVWGTVSSEWADRNAALGAEHTRISVKRVDFAGVLEQFGIPFFIKIDVEGADRHILDVLLAAKERPRHLSIESEKVDFDALLAEIALLSRLGYTKFRAVQQAWIAGTTVRCRDVSGDPFAYTFGAHGSGPFADDLPQTWMSREQLVDRYRSIFKAYRRFGDRSPVRRLPGGAFALGVAGRMIGRPMPGWYDTHATA